MTALVLFSNFEWGLLTGILLTTMAGLIALRLAARGRRR